MPLATEASIRKEPGQPYVRLPDFLFPFGTTCLADGTTFVSETKFHRIRSFAPDDREPYLVGGRGTDPGCFNLPRGVCTFGPDEIAVADTGNSRVQVIRASTGKAIRTISAGQLQKPWDVAICPKRRVFVVDIQQNCVKMFTEKGNCLKTLKEHKGVNVFEKPYRIEYHAHSGNLHIADSRSTRVHAISTECEYIGERELQVKKKHW